ncbi:DUF4870 domain-containing protein [Romboutsia sedimentorum]|uniref:DUF4870 domain-containing protein n=1 Tax=Romboutsia sedimentorum TaxID=1368474 RepID=A0ABT7ED17_9FIRM|nr:DUF4870 domain-containing protein [Romboutsia sedimentorum]MDK2563841.1 DUF4870 domain-containing protein [Romboutsia sedimentorum]MDK2585419.1 DUF4870 domain-containing protein [Romboutsia sedimentorum]
MENNKNFIPKENLIMLMMAGSIVLFNIIGFIVSYFVWKEYSSESDFIRINGKKLLNFHISFVIYTFIAGLSIIVLVGMILTPLVGLAYFILTIIGMVKYGSHKDYEYPLTFNFIS